MTIRAPRVPSPAAMRSSACLRLMLTTVLLVSGSVAAQTTCRPGQVSTIGRIQLLSTDCPVGSISQGQLTRCGASFQVNVDPKGRFTVTPLEQAKNKKAADLKFLPFDAVGPPLTTLVATKSGKLRMTAGHLVHEEFPPPLDFVRTSCRYVYTVVSGCVLGVAGKPYKCPSGWKVATGKGGVKFCEQCPAGSSSTGPNAKKCTPCPAGTITEVYGQKCFKCPAGTYSPKSGGSFCLSCLTFDPSKLFEFPAPIYPVAGRTCKACPKNSFTRAINADQCAACIKGRRCCTTNPSKSCPPCGKGFKPSNSAKATFVLTSASSPFCLINASKVTGITCPMLSFTAVVSTTCGVSLTPKESFVSDGCTVQTSEVSVAQVGAGGKLKLVGKFDTGGITDFVAASGPFVKLKARNTFSPDSKPKECFYTYRAVNAAAADVFSGISGLRCPKGKPGCLPTSGKCPAGQYRQPTVGGTSLCIKCWPGTYNPSPSSATSCKKCAKGVAAAPGFGSTKCT